MEINQQCEQRIPDDDFKSELIEARSLDQLDSGKHMESNRSSPENEVIKFVPPEGIHTLKLGIFITTSRVKAAFRQGNGPSRQK